MAVDERARHHLHGRLDEVLGADAATTLMGHLPPTGSSDVVSREYLDLRVDQLESRMDARFAQMDVRSARIDGRFDAIDERFVTLEAHVERFRNEVVAAFRGELNRAVVARAA